MSALEAGTYTVLAAASEPAWEALVEQHGGIALGVAAVAFRSAAAAVRCAVAIQESAAGGARARSADRRALAVPMRRRPSRPPGWRRWPARGRCFPRGSSASSSATPRRLRFGEAREVSLPGLAGRMVVHEVRWGARRRRSLRVVIADDAALVRDGVAALLRDNGVEVAATASDAGELHDAVARERPEWRSWTSACRRRSATKAWSRRSGSARASRTSACWCSRSI